MFKARSVTSGEVHDINVVLDFRDNKEDVHQALYADSPYGSDALQAALMARKISPGSRSLNLIK